MKNKFKKILQNLPKDPIMKFNTKDRNIFVCSDPHYSHRNLIKGLTSWKDSIKVTIESESDIIDSLKKVGYYHIDIISNNKYDAFIDTEKFNVAHLKAIPNIYYTGKEHKDSGAIRNFKSIDHHNDTLVNNINSTVGKDDVLFILGDVSFGGWENIEIFMKRIVCDEIHLIFGNHDENIIANKNNIKNQFTTTTFYREVQIDKDMFCLFHYPISEWNGSHKGYYHLYGHQHNLPENKFSNVGRSMDVGFDGNPDFKPYNIKEIIQLLKNKDKIKHH